MHAKVVFAITPSPINKNGESISAWFIYNNMDFSRNTLLLWKYRKCIRRSGFVCQRGIEQPAIKANKIYNYNLEGFIKATLKLQVVDLKEARIDAILQSITQTMLVYLPEKAVDPAALYEENLTRLDVIGKRKHKRAIPCLHILYTVRQGYKWGVL